MTNNSMHQTVKRWVEPDRLVWVILAAIIIFSTFASEFFTSPRNLKNIFFIQPIGLGLASLGQAFVVISGSIDLSAGAAISFMSCMAAGVMKNFPNISPVWVMLLFIVMGASIGAINGFIVVKLRVTPIMATLATMNILNGLTLFYTKRTIGGVPAAFRFLSDGRIFGVPFSIIWFLAVLIICYFILNKNKLGKYIYAAGSDAEVSALSGIHVPRIKFLAFVIGGVLVGLAAAFLTARLGGGGPRIGTFYEITVISAIVIGGISLAGGIGSLFCAVGGVLILTVFANIMNLTDLNPYTQVVFQGLLLISAVGFYSKQRVG
jgi:ribose/xylose/arabinose/galactoside ABC-type transport system permease subunit